MRHGWRSGGYPSASKPRSEMKPPPAQATTRPFDDEPLAKYLLVPREQANRWDWETAYERMQYFNSLEKK